MMNRKEFLDELAFLLQDIVDAVLRLVRQDEGLLARGLHLVIVVEGVDGLHLQQADGFLVHEEGDHRRAQVHVHAQDRAQVRAAR